MSCAYKLVVFDKDGTLGNDRATLLRWKDFMHGRTLEELRARGKESSGAEVIERWHAAIGWDNAAQKLVPSAPLATGTWEETLEISVRAMRHELPDVADLLQSWQAALGDIHGDDEPIVNDLGGMLKSCKVEYGVSIAVCTSDVRASTDAALRSWKIWQDVDHIVCGDEVERPKPCPEPLVKVCSMAGVSPKDCIMVGDTTHDIIMAKRAGAGVIVGVLSGSGEAQQLRDCGAHHVLQDVSHLPKLLSQL